MQVTLTRNETACSRIRDLEFSFDDMVVCVGGAGAPPSTETRYLTQVRVERVTRSNVFGAPNSNMDSILDEVVARVGA